MAPMLSASVNISEAAEAVRSFNRVYGEMEKAMWCLSRASRKALLQGESTEILAELVWTVKSWMGVQGVRREVKTLAARALMTMEWTTELFNESATFSASTEEFARERVSSLVRRMVELGAQRNEFSLASKILHWLLPWRIPVYDSFVRNCLQIPTSRTHDDAYREIIKWEFTVARRLMAEDLEWVGEADPKSPLRALDKYLWWKGGGSSGQAVVVRDPWKVVRHLGIVPS